MAFTSDVIVKDPEILGGTPVFRGTRVPFKSLLDYLEGGHTLDEFLRQFPTVTREMAIQALEEAKDSLLARIAWSSCSTNACRSTCATAFPFTKRTPSRGRELKGTKNGELLDAAESAGYNALLTMDQGFEHQLSLAGRGLALIILVARSNQMEDLVPLVPVALAALDQVRPGSVVRVQAP
jgi:uncharacterized protein (DUF433 family)